MQISWNQVADRVWYTVTQPHDANVVCIAGTDRAVLIDAGGTPEAGAAVLASAREMVGVPLEHVVITHHHDDHWRGLAGMDGVESIAHEHAVEDGDGLEVSRAFSLAVPLNLGDRFLEVVHFGEAHTRGDIVVVAQSAGVVVVGDLLEQSGEPQFDETSNLAHWPEALDAVLGAAGRNSTFIPGHGTPVDREFAFLQSGDLAILFSLAENLIRQGVKLDKAYETADEWPFSEEFVQRALPKVYAELEAEGIVPRTQLPISGI